MIGCPAGNDHRMEDPPICASVEHDLELLFDEITGPRPEWTPTGQATGQATWQAAGQAT